jgi:hypothetical protein
MRSRNQLVAFTALLAFSSAAWGIYQAAATGPAMTSAAGNFLKVLTEEQRKIVVLDYDTPKRVDWHFIPKPERKGLQIKDMNESQRQAAHALLKASLSEIGYDKATRIMSLENLLRELEKTKKSSNIRDPERYYFTVFGQPSESGRWGLSVEGHHLSLNFVVEKGKVISSTPSAFASNPATVHNETPGSQPKGTRLLAKEEVLAFELLQSLTPEQRRVAIIAEKALSEIRAAGQPQPPQEAPAGIPASKLDEKQRKTLDNLITAYAENLPHDVAEARWAAIRQSGQDQIHFAWAGAVKPGIGHYYRIQGPTFLIEFVNTQPDAAGNLANHIHCIWRDMRGDFAIPVTGS